MTRAGGRQRGFSPSQGGMAQSGAMPDYFFSVRDRHNTPPDQVPLDLPDLAAVRREAIRGARSLISADVQAGILDLSGTIEVDDAQGNRVLTLMFSEAVLRLA